MLEEPLLADISLKQYSTQDGNVSALLELKFEELQRKIDSIDQQNEPIDPQDYWTLMLKGNVNMISVLNTTKDYSSFLRRYLEETKAMDYLVPQIKESSSFRYSNEETNATLLLIHTAIFTMNCYAVLPNNFALIEEFGYSIKYSGLAIGLTFLGSLIASPLYIYWSAYSFKYPFLFSLVCMFIGNYLYLISIDWMSLGLLFFSRFVIGLGGMRILIRQYIVEKIPYTLLDHYSQWFFLSSYIGLSLAPLVTYLERIIKINVWFVEVFAPGEFVTYCVTFFVAVLFVAEAILLVDDNQERMNDNNPDKQRRSDLVTDEDINSVTELMQFYNDKIESFDMVKSLVDQEIQSETSSFGKSKRLFALNMFIYFLAKVGIETSLVILPILLRNKELPRSYSALIIFFFCISMIPTSFLVNSWFKNVQDRKVLLGLTATASVAAYMSCKLPEIWLHQDLVGICIFFLLCCTTELVVLSFIGKTTTQSIKFLKLNTGIILVILNYGGKFIGCFMIGAFSFFDDFNYQLEEFLFLSIMFAILSIVFLLKFKDLRVNAFMKIMRKHIVL